MQEKYMSKKYVCGNPASFSGLFPWRWEGPSPYFEHQMMIFVQSNLRRACSLELDEGLLSQSCPARQNSLKTLFLVHYTPYNQLIYLGAFIQNSPILAFTACVAACYEKEIEAGCIMLLLWRPTLTGKIHVPTLKFYQWAIGRIGS